MAKPYRVTAYVRFSNAINSSLVRLGVNIGGTSLLTVRGRKSGKPIETPISIFVQEGKRYLITPYGVVNWVRNLRAAGGEATLTRGRCTEKIHAIELEPVAAAPIFREAVRTGPPGIPAVFVRMYIHFTLSSYLNVAVNASLEEFEHEVLTHPVFLLQSADECLAVSLHKQASNDKRSLEHHGGSAMPEGDYLLDPLGFLHSPLKEPGEAPNQGREGAPDAWLEVNATVAEGLEGIAVGDEIIVITWLHKAQRDILKTHPRGDETMPLAGVFATRSPDRPNPLGLHRVTVLEIAGKRVKVGPIEAIDGTPVVDIKPVLLQSSDS